jgi:hypothetical protein
VTIARLISPATRSGLLTLAGSALIVAPLALGLGTAALLTGMAVGIVAVALGVAGTDGSGRGVLPLSAQAGYDRGLGLGLIAAGIAFGLAGESGALALFVAAGLVALVVTSITRYSASQA